MPNVLSRFCSQTTESSRLVRASTQSVEDARILLDLQLSGTVMCSFAGSASDRSCNASDVSCENTTALLETSPSSHSLGFGGCLECKIEEGWLIANRFSRRDSEITADYTHENDNLSITVIERLPEDAQTLHSEILALLLAREAERDWSHLSGSFANKQIKGAEYVYFQYSDPGGARRQFSVGRRSEVIDAIVAQYERGRAQQSADLAQVTRLAGLLRAAGVAMVPHAPARVIRALAEAGLFAVGGVLVGSYAFQVLGNLLGITWPGAAWRTQDIDIAAQLLVAVPELDADVPKALDALRMGFVPVPQLDAKQPSTSFRVRGKPLRVDLITPGGERDVEPVFIPRFQAAAAPIKFLSLVMREAQPAAVVDGTTASLVVVPSPARFALHKLLVSQTRSVIQQTKGGKDLHQAALLLETLGEDRPDDLSSAARLFAESGPAVMRKVMRGLQAAVKRWPDAEPGAGIVRAVLSE